MRISLDKPLNTSEFHGIGLQVSENAENKDIRAIVTNSNEVYNGDLFIALNGERTSGELYTDSAKERGALILSSNENKADIYAPDTERAFLSLASLYKNKLCNLKYTIAITGSVGKSTAKNMVRDALKRHRNVHATSGNFNNAIGVAHTLLSAPFNTEILVFELGMNHAGEITELSRAVAPDISVITNIGSAHIGNLGSRENIANAKLEITSGMKNPFAIIPNEEILLNGKCKNYTFSYINNEADCYVEPVIASQNAISFNVNFKEYTIKNIFVPIPGNHIFTAAAIVASVMDILEYSPKEIRESLENLNQDCVRSCMHSISNFYVYDDSYNSSPEGVTAALKLVKKHEGAHSAILGDMLELGDKSESLHEKTGEEVYKEGFDKLYAFGGFAEYIAKGAKDAGMDEKSILIFKPPIDYALIAKKVYQNRKNSETILLKASHSLRADKILDELKKIAKETESNR